MTINQDQQAAQGSRSRPKRQNGQLPADRPGPPTDDAGSDSRPTIAELEATRDALGESIDRDYAAAVEAKREHSLTKWADRRERDLARLGTATANLALSVVNGGPEDTAEIERLRVATSKEFDAAVRSQITSAADVSVLPVAAHRGTDRALLDRMRREIEARHREALLTPFEVKAVRSGGMSVGKDALERAGAKDVEELLDMSEAHDRQRRGL